MVLTDSQFNESIAFLRMFIMKIENMLSYCQSPDADPATAQTCRDQAYQEFIKAVKLCNTLLNQQGVINDNTSFSSADCQAMGLDSLAQVPDVLNPVNVPVAKITPMADMPVQIVSDPVIETVATSSSVAVE